MKIVFMGTPDFAVSSLEMLIKEGYEVALVVTQPDRPAGRGKGITPPPVKVFAADKGIRVLQPPKIRDEGFIGELKKACPELLVTAAYGRILPKEVLDIPINGCINVHASMLPKYRGAAPINWAIIKGEERTGITTMLTDQGMDTGNILLQRGIEIPDSITAGELTVELSKLGALVLKDTLLKLAEGTLSPIPQTENQATYAPMMDKSAGTIDWRKTSKEINNLIRGTNPWPGAFTFYKGECMKIWKADIYDEEYLFGREYVKSGTICRVSDEALLVKSGDGRVRITEIQFPSCRRISAKECWHNFDEGEVLG